VAVRAFVTCLKGGTMSITIRRLFIFRKAGILAHASATAVDD
jgi:hypothetical protein